MNAYNIIHRYLDSLPSTDLCTGLRKAKALSLGILNLPTTIHCHYSNKNDGLLNGVLLLDLTKALDTVEHELLLQTLKL